MKPIDVIILVAAALLAVGLFAFAIIRKKRGKSSCPFCDGGSCGSCGSCGGNCSACGVSLARKAQENQKNQESADENPQTNSGQADGENEK